MNNKKKRKLNRGLSNDDCGKVYNPNNSATRKKISLRARKSPKQIGYDDENNDSFSK